MKGFTFDPYMKKWYKEFNCGSMYYGLHCFIIYNRAKKEIQVMVGVVSGNSHPEFYPTNIIFSRDFVRDRFDVVLRTIKDSVVYTNHYLTNYYLQGRG